MASSVRKKTNDSSRKIDVFISYNWQHQDIVRLIYNGLESEGIACWMDEKKMIGGDNLYQELAEGLETCILVVACVTQKYTESRNCGQEMKFAYDKGKAVIPVLLENVKWPLSGDMGFVLAGRLYIDLSDSSQELREWTGAKVDDLVKSVNEQLSVIASFPSKKADVTDTSSTLYRSPPENCVNLLIFYKTCEFQVPCSDAYPLKKYKWSEYPHIKCTLRGMTAGLKPFTVVRDALSSVFTGEVKLIGQRCGSVARSLVAEVTSRDKDEVEVDKESRLFCNVEGEQYSWHEAGEPTNRKGVRVGDNVIICGGQRRTVLVIRP